MKRALLIVDVQNDFLPGGSLAVPKGDEIIPVINALMRHFDCIVATKDWHPPHHMSFASEHPGKKTFDVTVVNGLRQELWPDHCVQGSRGAEMAPALRQELIQLVFHKGTDRLIDSYSAFFDNAHLRTTGLFEFFKSQGIDEVFITGLATEYCVKFSALDARKLGLEVTVILDGCRGIDVKAGDIEKAYQEMREAGCNLLFSKAL